MSGNENLDAQTTREKTENSPDNSAQRDRPAKDKQSNIVPKNAAAIKEKITAQKEKSRDKTSPPGGHDDTPIPSARDGYTVEFTFHRAENLPVSDVGARSSDPYLTATLTSPGIRKRHKEDPDMILRTKTIHKSTNPEWNQHWVVANIPYSGFRLKCRLYDEDPRDHDDRLGNVTVFVNNIGESWPGIREESYVIKKRMGSKRAYLLKGCVAMLSREVHINGHLILSMRVLGKSEQPYGRMYTIGPTNWTRHYSPTIGRIAGTKNPEQREDGQGKAEKYDFQANQFQLQGPVPTSLYHRYVEFKPFVKGMFSKAGLRGRVLNKLLHHQHRQIYNFSTTTEYGTVKPKSIEASQRFLEMVHYDKGGRIFTYVLTLDGLMRFTETGKEFGIDLLSKHTMHSNVNIYIACSGEFFVRRLSNPEQSAASPDQKTHPAEDIPGGPPNEPAPKGPKNYELVIDNDSGTYRPKGSLLGDLKGFLSENFPDLHIVVKECTDDELSKWKKEQREFKKKQGKSVNVVQNSDDEISSSDEEALDRDDKARKSGKKHKTGMERAYQALEDPVDALKEVIPGEKGRTQREQRETEDDMAGEGTPS